MNGTAEGNLDLAGRPLEDAVDVVIERRDGADREKVRTVLDTVVEDGVITATAAEDAVAHVSKVVATPETRIELAGQTLDEVREAAEPVEDVPIVAARLESFEDRLADLRDSLGDLQAELEMVTQTEDFFEVAAGVERLRVAANETQTAADELLMELDDFESWLERPTIRYREFREDTSVLAEALDDLAATVDRIESADDDSPHDDESGRTWAVARLRHRALALMAADLWAELAGLGTLDELDDIDSGEGRAACRERLNAVDRRLNGLEERLQSVADPGFELQYGDRVAAFDEVASSFEPPVDWDAVQRTFEQHRSELES